VARAQRRASVRRRSPAARVVGGSLLGVFTLAVLGAGALVLSTLPSRRGRARVAGLRSAVRIETDARGIPTIRAGSIDDVLFGLGWVHARERLWQMEFQRRVGAGRLAEVLGPRLLPTDRFLRTVGFRRAAESAWASLSPAARARVGAYRGGINAYLASTTIRPPEARLLRVTIAPFDDVDCVVWLKLMAWDLSGNASSEIRRAKLVARIGPERTAEILVPAPEAPTILRDGEWIPPPDAASAPAPPAKLPAPPKRSRPRRLDAGVAGLVDDPDPLAALGFGGESIGSNTWVVAGSRTRTRLPLLANDPHLGLRSPAVFFLARLETPELSVEGATLPGVPGVVIGRTDRIAWGLTALEPDVEDLFLERPDPADAGRYLWNGRSLPFETRTETIAVRGAATERLVVRSTVHGPIVTDALSGADSLGAPVSLRWTGLDPEDRTAEALLALEGARDWAGFLAAASLLHCPSMNLVYADRDGHIGYTASGAIPIRPRADGLLPASGDGTDDWTGTIPFGSLPRVLDPPRGYIVTANHRVVSSRYPWPLSRDFVEPYRARRIEDRLAALSRASADDMRSIQRDHISYQARDVLPLIASTPPADDASRNALRRLAGWDFDFSPRSVPATIYAAWYAELSKMPEDELGEPAAASVRSRFLMNALASDSPWCDDVRTPKRETCAAFASAALARAVGALRARLGKSPEGWRWERLHIARFPHAVLDGVPLMSKLATLQTGRGGDGSTVDVGAYRRDGTFRMTDGPSYRQVVDFDSPRAARWVGTTGQSGNFFERGYRDFLPLWRDGQDFAMSGEPGAGEVFLLEPK
jgi:penicillin amidase